MSGAVMHSGVYVIPAIHVGVKGVFTNTVPVDAYRGAGRPEAAYAIERLIDYAARQLDIAPQELRRRNFIKPEAMPYRTPLGLTYDSGEFARNMDQALAAADLAGFPARRAEAQARGQLSRAGARRLYRAIGFSAGRIRRIAFRPERHPDDSDGDAIIRAGASDRLYPARCRAARRHARKGPRAAGRHRGDFALAAAQAARGRIPVGGAALAQAAEKLIAKGRRIAAHLFEAAEADVEFADGVFSVAGTDRRFGIEEVARAAFDPARQAPGVEPGFDESGHFTPPQPTFPNGCHVCEVEIDPETGHIEILRYLVVDDFGTVINPLLLAGQVQGGVAQGVGQAMLEHRVYDLETGQLLTGSLTDYCLPRAEDLPAIEFS